MGCKADEPKDQEQSAEGTSCEECEPARGIAGRGGYASDVESGGYTTKQGAADTRVAALALG